MCAITEFDCNYFVFFNFYSIKFSLRNIIKDAGNKEAVGIGALTSEDRDEWTEAREHLLSLEGNKAK